MGESGCKMLNIGTLLLPVLKFLVPGHLDGFELAFG